MIQCAKEDEPTISINDSKGILPINISFVKPDDATVASDDAPVTDSYSTI